MSEDDPSNLTHLHDESVKRVQERMKYFHESKKKFRVFHGTTGSTRNLQFHPDSIVDISDMNRCFPVDKESRTVRVEPNVPMDALAAHTLKSGLVPKVVMELKGLTAGGGFSCLSGESNSFKYGLFEQTVSEIEIVLADGTRRVASRHDDEAKELIEAAGGSLGTIGIVTLLTVQLLDARPFVDVDLIPLSNIADFPKTLAEAVDDASSDFVDGIAFSKDRSVVMVGRYSDARDPEIPLFTKMQIHWFSDAIEKALKKKVKKITLSLHDYLFRYDHGAFWGGKLAFQHFHVPNNRITRRLADPFLDSRTCYHALHKTGIAEEYVVQDFGLPWSRAVEFMQFSNDNLGAYGLQMFICPAKSAQDLGLTGKLNSTYLRDVFDERVINVGVYGRGPRSPRQFCELNRLLESKAHQLNGTKLLYARTYYTEEEFWDMYDRERYDALRKKYGAEGLPNMYEKLHADMGRQAAQQQQQQQQQQPPPQNGEGKGSAANGPTSGEVGADERKGRRRKAMKGVVETVIDKAAGRIGDAKRSPLLLKA